MSAYSSLVISDGPFQYWRCNDSAGGYLQDSHAATPRPLIAQGQQIGTGYSGPVSDGGSCLTDANFGFAYYDTEVLSNPLTVECWFWQAYYQGLQQNILTFNTLGGVSTCVIRTGATGLLSVFGSAGSYTGSTPLDSSKWHYVAVTFDGTNMRTYLEGSLIDTRANGAFSQASSYVIGTARSNVTPMAGSVSEVAVYAAALSGTQIAAHFVAADQAGVNPTNQSQQGGGGALPPPFGPAIDDIRNAVIHTFPATT